MNWVFLTVVCVALVANCANAEQDKAFKQRAEIYSSKFISRISSNTFPANRVDRHDTFLYCIYTVAQQ